MTATSAAFSAESVRDLGERLSQALRLRTQPFAMKLLEDAAAMEAIPKLRRPAAGSRFTLCQIVTQCRLGGLTLGVTVENLIDSGLCGSIVGLNPPSDVIFSGRFTNGVWFANQEAAAEHQKQMPRVPAGRYSALVMSPLRSARIDDPDIVLFYATPAQTILFVNGLQHVTYRRYDMTITGETACADSWGRALRNRETSISIPCFAERRYGGVAEDEMLVALPPAELARGIDGLDLLSKNGLRYPILPYGVNQDATPGLAVSYGNKV